MPVPTDPGAFLNGAIADASEVNARFDPLYEALDGALDETNMAVPKGVFRVYRGTNLNVPASPGLITFDTEQFDTSGWYDEATGRFTPLVAGYYRFAWGIRLASVVAGQELLSSLWKNGAVAAYGQTAAGVAGHTHGPSSVGATILSANGSTDYFDVRAYVASSPLVDPNAASTFFCGELIGRSA